MIKGIINISGPVGIGKTAMALECGVKPTEIAMLNWDVKHPGFDLGDHQDFLHLQQHGTELDACNAAIKWMNNLEAGTFRVLVLDAWEEFVKTLTAFIVKNEKKLRSFWFGGGEWKKRQMYGYRGTLESAILENLQKKVDTIFIINHLSYLYRDGVKTERMVPTTSDDTIRHCIARFYLNENTRISHPAPSAIVLKNMPKRVWNPEVKRIESPNVLPPRLDVQCLENWQDRPYISMWDVVNHYLENPVLNRPLLDYEALDENEQSIVYQTLTDDEKEGLEFAKKLAVITRSDDLQQEVFELNDQGLSPLQISLKLKGQYPEATVGKVKKLLDVINGE